MYPGGPKPVHPQGNEGTIPAKDKGTYPRPLGGPEPSAQMPVPGVTNVSQGRPDIPDGNGAYNVGYDYTAPLGDSAQSDVMRGYRQQGRITDAGSDGEQIA